ncbi:unnamed protein product [Prunus armeniaca]
MPPRQDIAKATGWVARATSYSSQTMGEFVHGLHCEFTQVRKKGVAQFWWWSTGSPTDCNAEEAAPLFLKHVVKYWGIPKSIISDRDTRFTGKLWTELFRLLGSQLNFSTSFHPQTDGQTERVNTLLELYLRHYVSANQRDWAKLLDVAQFSYNLQRSESTGSSPFKLATGQQPMTPNTVVSGYTGSSSAAYKTTKEWQVSNELARAKLEKATRKMKK